MRQAGRSLPEYRELRRSGSILDAIGDAATAAEITLQPVRRHGVDAAILFSDIVVPVHAIGFGVEIVGGVGPVIDQPFRHASDLTRLRPFEPDVDAPYVAETCRLLVRDLAVPLIGFAGAPFTVASYLVEGRPSKTYQHTKTMMRSDPALFAQLLDRLADIAIASLTAQVAAGASAIQLFDSWAGALSPDEYRDHVAPASAKVMAAVGALGVPRLHFGVHTGELLDQMAAVGADVVGVDWRTPLTAARQRVPADTGLQGNLDPTALLAGWDATEREARQVIEQAGDHSHYVFNLGHGVLPETDPGVLTALVDFVHETVPSFGGRPDASATVTRSSSEGVSIS